MSRGVAHWRAKGALDAASGRAWDAGALFSPRIRRAWLAGWMQEAVALHMAIHPISANDFGLFHAKRRAAGRDWTAAELDLLDAGCRGIPRAPASLVAGILGRSVEAVRSKASRCGYVRSA